LNLATAAIGLLSAFVTTKGVTSVAQLFLLSAAGISFIAVIGMLLYVFRLNREYLISESQGKKAEEGLMLFLDKAVRIFFCIGVLFTVLFAFNIAKTDLEKSIQKTQVEQVMNQKTDCQKSLAGGSRLETNESLAGTPSLLQMLSTMHAPAPAPAPAPAVPAQTQSSSSGQ